MPKVLLMAGSPSEYWAGELALTRQAFDLLTHARATFSFSFFLSFFFLFLADHQELDIAAKN